MVQAAAEQVQPAVRQAAGGQGRVRVQRAERDGGAGGRRHSGGDGPHCIQLTHHALQVTL